MSRVPTVIAFLITLIAFANLVRAQAEDARPDVDDSKVLRNVPAAKDLPTLRVVGDSTVNAGANTKGMRGWGQVIAQYFDATKINVVDRAIGGRSSKTFITDGRWDPGARKEQINYYRIQGIPGISCAASVSMNCPLKRAVR